MATKTFCDHCDEELSVRKGQYRVEVKIRGGGGGYLPQPKKEGDFSADLCLPCVGRLHSILTEKQPRAKEAVHANQ